MKTLNTSNKLAVRSEQVISNTQRITTALLFSLGILISGQATAASCQSYLQNEVNWAGQAPGGTIRSVGLVMTANDANRFSTLNATTPEVGYLATSLKKGGWIFSNALVGSGNTLFNNHLWYQGFIGHPFNPNDTEKWTVSLHPTANTLWVARNGKNFIVSVDCVGHLISGTHTHFVSFGNFKFPIRDTHYTVSLTRKQYSILK